MTEGTIIRPAGIWPPPRGGQRRLGDAPRPRRRSAWALERFGRDLVLAASFQDIVLVDLATTLDPGIEVVFLDTGAHFPETLAFVDEVRDRYGLNLTVTQPGPEADGVALRVDPLLRAPQGRSRCAGPSPAGRPGSPA